MHDTQYSHWPKSKKASKLILHWLRKFPNKCLKGEVRNSGTRGGQEGVATAESRFEKILIIKGRKVPMFLQRATLKWEHCQRT